MATLEDIFHVWGNDLSASTAGDLLRVSGVMRSQQRVLRRLLTNGGEYLSHPEYGGGLAGLVGSRASISYIKTLIKGQMLLEPSVAKTPAPVIEVIPITGGFQVNLSYTALPDQQPTALSFSVDP